MKFGNFLFPDSRDPEHDGVVIDETLREAWLSDELGVDAIWLAEHHFDGICAYADPIALCRGARRDDPPRQNRFCGAADGAAPSDPPRGAVGGARQPHQGAADRRARPRLLLQYLRLPGLWHRPSRSPGAARRGRGDPGPGLDRRRAFATTAGFGTWTCRCCARAPIRGLIRRSSAPPRARPRCSHWRARGGRF